MKVKVNGRQGYSNLKPSTSVLSQMFAEMEKKEQEPQQSAVEKPQKVITKKKEKVTTKAKKKGAAKRQ